MPVSVTKVKEIAKVKELFDESEGSAGARSIAQMATDQDVPLSRYRASRLMKKLGLISCQIPGHTYKKTGNEHVEIPNELNRQFNVEAPNRVWCGDVTYIWTGNRWAYLAVVKYLIGYYSQLRPHQHNGGISPNQAEENYWNNYKSVASFT